MKTLSLLFLVLLLAVAVVVSLSLGKYPLPVGEVAWFCFHKLTGWKALPADRLQLLENVILDIRLPRILAASLIGSALSVSGAAYQAMFVNPLVSPDLLGVLAGASFGAAFGMLFLKTWFGVQAASFLGGIAAVGIALFIAKCYRINSIIMLVLGGVISGAFFTALVAAIKYISDPFNQLPAITFWLMGTMTMTDRGLVLRAGLPILAGIITLLLLSRQLNALSMGDDEARSLGIHVEVVRYAVIFCATLISALTAAMAGIIGWVGLIIPHITRMMVGPDNQRLMPAAALLGATYLLVVDDVARLCFSFEIPIGIVTSLVGIPFFLVVMRNTQKGWQ